MELIAAQYRGRARVLQAKLFVIPRFHKRTISLIHFWGLFFFETIFYVWSL
jgi:hypothetical protein